MLSKPAFNALLKTLEEPPSHVIFILATTDLHKVPATIISRTQHFALHSISQADLAAHLKDIAKGEGIKIADDAVTAIAARGDGSFRNSISLLDQLSSFADDKEGITLDLVQTTLGLAPDTAVDSILEAITTHDVASVIGQLDTLEKQGIQPTIFADQLITAIRQRLASEPHLVSLLDALLSVAGSSQPNLKLLTVLVGAIKPKTAAAPITKAPPIAIIEAPIKIIEPPQSKAKEPEPATAPEPVKNGAKKRQGPLPTELDWPKLIEYTRENLLALHSVLSKCSYELDGDKLTLYTGRKFNKTKLDEVKYQTQLHEALEQVGFQDVYIITLPTAAPPADEQLAKVAEMMGGGQEVTLDET